MGACVEVGAWTTPAARTPPFPPALRPRRPPGPAPARARVRARSTDPLLLVHYLTIAANRAPISQPPLMVQTELGPDRLDADLSSLGLERHDPPRTAG